MWRNPRMADRIMSVIPAGKTRSVPTPMKLGEGAEGTVFPSVTAGQGDTAVKVFRPSEDLPPDFPRNTVSPRERGRIMASDPSVFPLVHGYGDRHIIMERLQSPSLSPGAFLDRGPLRNELKATIARARQKPSPPGQRGSSAIRRSDAVSIAEEFRIRHTGGRYGKDFSRIEDYIRRFPTANSGRRISDVGEGHNVMLSRRGRLVISDPLIYESRPSVRPGGAIRPEPRRLHRYTAAGLASLLGALATPARAPQGDGR